MKPSMDQDSRIPVFFEGQPGPDDMTLLEEGMPPPTGHVWPFSLKAAGLAPGHAPGCGCCVARGAAAVALGALFRARALGTVPGFGRLLVRASPAGRLDILSALEHDLLCNARFRPGE